ncbi:Uncharacterized protein APZ42_026862 [Daphnia magna]|uniref:Uncharacterized protein n=1 Tax=Daphnia magna TaxID=35525 RepID=A0A0P5XPI6_9CRUS|nr:Uncharacterized protein APZ42_026862 [Daphnia magna]
MAPIILSLTVLFLGCLVQSGEAEAVVDVIHSLTHQFAPVSAVHWPAILGDDRSHRTGNIDGRLERSLFGSSGSSSASSGICSEQSEISENTIIRTKDSRALGARFLNETSLGADARDRCLNLCCAFHGCNVAVYEEKDGGNCYLFDCGPAEDFRCKFTSHSHYTSGVIRRRENAHEEELTQLKKISMSVVTTVKPIVTIVVTNPSTTTAPPTAKPVRTCSRYQFECHTTRECIAIYNACDGISQCSDGSDEAPELGCPATTTETSTARTLVTKQPVIDAKISPVDIQQNLVIAQHPPLDWRGSRIRDRYSEQDQVASVDLPPNTDVNHWRAGPDNTRNYERSHNPYQTGTNGEALPYAVEPDRPVNPYYSPDIRHYGSTWTERQERPISNVNDYRAADNTYYYDKDARSPYDANGNVYPSVRKHDWGRNNAVIVDSSPPQHALLALPVETRPSQIQPVAPIVLENPHPLVSVAGPVVEKVPAVPEQKVVKTPELTTVPPTVVVPTTTTITQPKSTISAKIKTPSLITKPEIVANHAHIHHFIVSQADFQEEKAERSRQTVGAAWALTLGLSVTAVLVLLVGCRLRSLKRHLRRGRSGHTRDADYLVNGMYL